MVLKRLWRFFKKVFRKKRKPHRRRLRQKSRGKKKRPLPPNKKKNTSLKKYPRTVAEKPVKAVLAGTVTHYFPKVNAAVIKLKKPLHVGDPVLIKGPKTNIRQTVGSMQINRIPIEKARAGQEIGLEVFKEVRPQDSIYLIKG